MGTKTKKKTTLQVVPPSIAPPAPEQPTHRPVAVIQQEGMNLMSVIGSKYYVIKNLKKEIAQLELHAEKLDAEGASSQAYYALKSAEENQKKQQEQPK